MRANQSPPILQTIFHSSEVTGCTDSREYFISAILASFVSTLIDRAIMVLEVTDEIRDRVRIAAARGVELVLALLARARLEDPRATIPRNQRGRFGRIVCRWAW
jgi:hypothetical protein